MAKITISDLQTAGALAGTEEMAVVQSGFTKKAAVSALPISSATQTALNDKVNNTGNETIAGVKTFSSSPIVPTPTGGTDAANKTYVDNAAQSAPPGAMLPFAGSSTPTGWLLCDGSAVSRTTYSSLFTALGTTWGSGDGSTTFNLPDMRAAAPVGAGTSTGYTQNETYNLGTKYNDQMQGHRFRAGVSMNAGESGIYGNTTTDVPGAATARHEQNAGTGSFQTLTSLPITDGTNGTPRTGTITRGKVVGVNYIIKT